MMKKEKITTAVFVIPLFLFSINIKQIKSAGAKGPSSSLFNQKNQTLNKSQAAASNQPRSYPIRPVDKTELLSFSSQEPQRTKQVPPANNRTRVIERRNLSTSGKKIGFLNIRRPFRSNGPRYRPDQVLVKFKETLPDTMREAAIEAYQARKLKRIPGLDIYKLQIPEWASVEEMVYVLSQNPDVEYAEPNYKMYIAVTPNDTLFAYQYALSNRGQEIGSGGPQGTQGADIKATSGWEETKGEEEIIIAIIDTGVDFTHPDIDDKIESTGYDFINDDSDATDDNWHGTHVAGVAAAETNNSEGIAGVAWNCKVLPIKVLDENGEGDYSDAVEGITWAADHDADVINLSFGGDAPSSALEDALEYAYEKNIVVVAAAGNDGGAVLYPAAYDDYCLAVAATNYNDERVTYSNSGGVWESNYGPEVDIAAPGQRILSLVPSWLFGPDYLPYAWGFGTSAAAPHVAGLAALIKSIKPHLTVDQIMSVIRYSADDVNSVSYPGKDNFIGYGRINMRKALVPIIITPSAYRQ